MRAPAGRRPSTECFVPDHRLTTPTPVDPWQLNSGGGGTRRDSDSNRRRSSFYSTRVSNHRTASDVAIKDRSYQRHAVSTINSYLSARSFSISFKPNSLPSNKDITETLKFVVTRLEYPISNKIEDDLFIVLKHLNCPIKMNKSDLKAPGTPHSFPSVVAVLHWLVQIAKYNEHLANSTPSQLISEDAMLSRSLQQERNLLEENLKVKLVNAKDLEAKLEAMKSSPLLRESMEVEQGILEKDITKFNELIKQLQAHEANVDKLMEEKEMELGIKLKERRKMCDENDELRKKVEEQGMNVRDAERIKRELQSVERDLIDAEFERNKWEEKCWDLDDELGKKFKELEALQIDCNQTMLRYGLNDKGLTPAEVFGMDYKSTLKPALKSAIDEVKRSSMENLETLISLQQLSRDITTKVDAKRRRIGVLQSLIEEVETQINLIKKETQDHVSTCAMEARQLVDNFQAECHKVDLVENEARQLVENSKAKLQKTIMQNEEECQMCALELLALIDSVSKYKESMQKNISQMKNDISETANAITQVHKEALGK